MPARIELSVPEFEKLTLPDNCIRCLAETKHTSAAWLGSGAKTSLGAIAFPCCESCDGMRKFKRLVSIAGLCVFVICFGIGFVRGFVAEISEVDPVKLPAWVNSLGTLGLVLWLSQRDWGRWDRPKPPLRFEGQDGDKITIVIYNDAFVEKMRELNPSLAMSIIK